MKAIVVTTRNVYGQDKIYPVCEHAHMLAELAGTKTFTDHAIKLIKKMGIHSSRRAEAIAPIHLINQRGKQHEKRHIMDKR